MDEACFVKAKICDGKGEMASVVAARASTPPMSRVLWK